MTKLTELQKSIIAAVIEGKNNTKIASELNYSKGKIQKELGKIYKFFGIKNLDANAKRAILIREVIKIELASI